MTREELLERLHSERVRELCARYRVRELCVFGSLTTSAFSEASDVDLLVEFLPDARMDLFELTELTGSLAELLGRRVDLVSKRGLKPLIRESVLQSAQVVYAA